jgi:hypothetical protein
MWNARVLILCTAIALCACHRESGSAATGQPVRAATLAPVAVKKGPSAQQLTAGMVEAADQGRSQVPVDLKFDLSGRPTVGHPVEIAVAVMPQMSARSAAIEITSAEGLDVAQGSRQIDLASVEPGEVYRQNIKLTPTADGVLFLGLTILLQHDEITESRAFSIPLIVER